MDTKYLSLTRKIHIYCALITKIAGQDRESRLAEFLPGLTGLDAGVLQILSAQPGSLGSLSEQMMLAPATLVPVIDRLERRGWLRREQDPHDRRRNNLVLTEAGQVTARQVPGVDTQEKLMNGILALGEEKARQLGALLEELLSDLIEDPRMLEGINRRLAME